MACPVSPIWQGQTWAVNPSLWVANPGRLTITAGRWATEPWPVLFSCPEYPEQTFSVIRCHSEKPNRHVRVILNICDNFPNLKKKICFPHCSGNTVGKLLECFSKIVYRFENCLGFVIASVVCFFVSSRFSKCNKHFSEEQNNWSHTCGFPDLFYMCMQYSVTQNMFKPSASNHLWCCGQDQSRTQESTHGPRPHHSPASDHSAWGQVLAPVTHTDPSRPMAGNCCNRLPQKAKDAVCGSLVLETWPNLGHWRKQQAL